MESKLFIKDTSELLRQAKLIIMNKKNELTMPGAKEEWRKNAMFRLQQIKDEIEQCQFNLNQFFNELP